MEGYRRPAIERGEFRDAAGAVIPYGARWRDTPPEDLPYSVTAHPERFAPVAEVARALAAAIAAAHRPGGGGVPIEVEVTPFPGAILRVAGHDFPFPVCGCDACDEDVEELADEMEQLVDAVVAGRFRADAHGVEYWGDWGARGRRTSPQGRV